MTWVTGILVYIVLWWLIFIAALPWGVRSGADHDAGEDAGAPVNPALWKKALAATVIAGILLVGVHWLVDSGVVDSLIKPGRE